MYETDASEAGLRTMNQSGLCRADWLDVWVTQLASVWSADKTGYSQDWAGDDFESQ